MREKFFLYIYKYAKYIPRPIRRFLRNMLYLKLIFSNIQHRAPLIGQKMFTYISRIELSDTPKTLKEIFNKAGVKYREGCHLIYVYRKEDIERINKDLVKVYPGPIGLKIFFSTEISPDGSVYYISNRHHCNNDDMFYVKSVGTIKEKMDISNILSISSIAPRVYDVINLRHQKILLQAMVVEHIEGSVVQGHRGLDFLGKLYEKLEEEHVERISKKTLTPKGFRPYKDIDFTPPKYNNNIVEGDKGVFYVDIQNFRLDRKKAISEILPDIKERTHFGNTLALRGRRYSYQSIPFLGLNGKRNTAKRFKMLDYFLPENGIRVEGIRILDVGCNLGIFITYFLNRGASWCTGVDLPEIADLAKRFLFYQGFSRFDLIGCDLKKVKMPFNKQEYEVILYLSISHHIGFPDWLDDICFESMIFEGKEGQNVEDAKNILLERFPDMRVVFEDRVKDGDCGYRPFVILK